MPETGLVDHGRRGIAGDEFTILHRIEAHVFEPLAARPS